MPNVRLTPDAHPSQIEKTLRYEAAHTSETMNRITEELVGSPLILNGLQVVQEPGVGLITLEPGSFLSGAVIVTLKEPLSLDYSDLLDANGNLARTSGRKKTLILYGNSDSSSEFSPVTFGFIYDDLEDTIFTDDRSVKIATLQSDDELAVEDDDGRWTKFFGYSVNELGRDTREGIQTIEGIPFASGTGVLRPNPSFLSGPYFTDDRQLLAFADRFLLPSEKTLSASPSKFSRRDIRGINETGVDVAAFDFGGLAATDQNLVSAQWGIVVSRDIEWQQGNVLSAAQTIVTVTAPNQVAVGEDRLLVFLNGLWLEPAEYTEAAGQITLVSPATGGEVLQLVHFRSVVFLETLQLERTDLAEDTDVPQDHIITLSEHLYDRTRHSLLVFARLSGTAETDGGYIQINRVGTGTRAGQEFIVRDGFEMADGGSIRLKGVTIAAGTTATIGILCIRGSTSLNFQSADQTQVVPFFRRWTAVADAPLENQLRAFPTLDGFVTAAPGGSASVSVALNEVDSSFEAPDGTVIEQGQFTGYTLLQGPGFEDETSANGSPRSINGSSIPIYGNPTNFTEAFVQVILEVPLGAPGAAVGDPVKLQGGHVLEGLPPYAIGEQKLRVAINGILLISGVDYEEASNTSIVLRHPLGVGDILEAWAE